MEVIIFIVAFIVTFIIAFQIADKADSRNDKYITNALIVYIKELFAERNCFGKILSSVIFIIGIPAFLFIILIQIGVSAVRFIIKIWDLGNKK